LGKRCVDFECPYIASDGTCLLPEDELKEKCPVRERVGREDKDEWIDEDFIREKLKSNHVMQ
jgi:hypothetical protein